STVSAVADSWRWRAVKGVSRIVHLVIRAGPLLCLPSAETAHAQPAQQKQQPEQLAGPVADEPEPPEATAVQLLDRTQGEQAVADHPQRDEQRCQRYAIPRALDQFDDGDRVGVAKAFALPHRH